MPVWFPPLLFQDNTMAEGLAPFLIPGSMVPCHTWYKTFGDWTTGQPPLVILHGGPGACHDYLLPLQDLPVPTVFYDQIGNGKSSHLPEKNGDRSFWTVDLFKAELDNLLNYLGLDARPIDVLGHSWGGMLASEWAAGNTSLNLRRLILSSSPASMDGWIAGVDSLRKQLPEEDQAALATAEATGDFQTAEYEAAIEEFYKRHLSLTRPNGPSEITITGSLRGWTVIPKLSHILVPTLLINGEQDECQDVAMQPFFDGIRKVRWITLNNAAHFAHIDQRTKYMEKLMDDNNVLVFSKSYCPYCKATKQALDKLNADYLAIELDIESDGSAMQDAVEQLTGQRTVPNVLIQRKHIGGNSDIQALVSNGKLAELLQQSGALKA
ncbi:hypothetical protein CP532_0092 [Ophiocordyceps camponoti-leonardi (nom. inval.)]|nr:hypothetical protein CP532_0092 [Ophiocordyceps camponoti-leonardi (nom. inval.)]